MDPFSLDHIFPRTVTALSLSRLMHPFASAGAMLRPVTGNVTDYHAPRSLFYARSFRCHMDRPMRLFFFPSLELSKNMHHGCP